ncbi:hypothetical protein Lepto7376_3066 [[Leptolyngbya] sp. PCC 7376]|uniref:hypothetical protein n=1 Tax=[Leptolyngbya] sp. PCC 7376 TaxID=111781 RepID=UPI00029ED62D|nr:hypothetical protein [[Leptolyngbya] sp. PCC 7376]AFY39306.1 hypothetical protein Lepto7376_3066 [[Leptolyngbya] sp. PCC 7376]
MIEIIIILPILIFAAITFLINRWNIFLYYSLAVLMGLYMVSYSEHVYILNPLNDIGPGYGIGLFILVLIQVLFVAVLFLRLVLFIYGAFKQKRIRRDMLSKQTLISILLFFVCGIIFSKAYYHLNHPYKNLDENMRGQHAEQVIMAHHRFGD